MRIYEKIGNNRHYVPKITKFVHVSFICTKITKISTYFLFYVPK